MLLSSVTLVVPWTEVTQLEKNATLVFPESIRVSTRHTEHFFSMFLNINDTFKLMEQLANIAMRQLLDNEVFAADHSLPKPCKTLKNISTLKRFSILVLSLNISFETSTESRHEITSVMHICSTFTLFTSLS